MPRVLSAPNHSRYKLAAAAVVVALAIGAVTSIRVIRSDARAALSSEVVEIYVLGREIRAVQERMLDLLCARPKDDLSEERRRAVRAECDQLAVAYRRLKLEWDLQIGDIAASEPQLAQAVFDQPPRATPLPSDFLFYTCLYRPAACR